MSIIKQKVDGVFVDEIKRKIGDIQVNEKRIREIYKESMDEHKTLFKFKVDYESSKQIYIDEQWTDKNINAMIVYSILQRIYQIDKSGVSKLFLKKLEYISDISAIFVRYIDIITGKEHIKKEEVIAESTEKEEKVEKETINVEGELEEFVEEGERKEFVEPIFEPKKSTLFSKIKDKIGIIGIILVIVGLIIGIPAVLIFGTYFLIFFILLVFYKGKVPFLQLLLWIFYIRKIKNTK